MRPATHTALNPRMRLNRVIVHVAWIAVLFTSATHAGGAAPDQASPAQTVSQIAGSIIQSTARPSIPVVHAPAATSASVNALANEPGDAEDIKAVCITSGPNMEGCGATLVHDSGNHCGDADRHDPEPNGMDQPSSWCHGHAEPERTHAPHVAVCDVDDVGLAGCLEKYATSLVKHAAVAKRVYQFNGHDKDARIITVLATARQTEHDAEQMATGYLPDASIIPVQ